MTKFHWIEAGVWLRLQINSNGSTRKGTMKLVVWNCNQALHRKASHVLELAPDIAIIPEAARQARTLTAKASGSVWIGAEKNKGLGVYSFNGFRIELHSSYDKRLQWIAPVLVSGPTTFLLLATWALNDQASEKHPEQEHRGQVATALEVYRDVIEQCGMPLVIAGDFNGCIEWDKREKHPFHFNTVRDLINHGLVSAYHTSRKVSQGQEADPTYWRDRTPNGQRFHIDYCFVPKSWMSDRLEVLTGEFDPWVANHLSDHAPLVVTIPA